MRGHGLGFRCLRGIHNRAALGVWPRWIRNPHPPKIRPKFFDTDDSFRGPLNSLAMVAWHLSITREPVGQVRAMHPDSGGQLGV